MMSPGQIPSTADPQTAPTKPATESLSGAAAPQPSIGELFVAFAKISLSGFGGVLAWARRMMVEERKWMTP
jgi:chromate transporter